MSQPKDYDSTVARIAGNIASGLMLDLDTFQQINVESVAETAVMIARAIVVEVKRTDPPKDPK